MKFYQELLSSVVIGAAAAALILGAGALGCGPERVMKPPVTPCASWEYKTLYAQPKKLESRDIDGGGAEATSITPSDEELTKEGKDGWELMTTYLELETGYLETDKQILPNIRPQRLVMIFKRTSCPK